MRKCSAKEGKQCELKGWTEIDLNDVKDRLAKVIEEAKGNDPSLLKKRIAELERQAKNTIPATAGTVTKFDDAALRKEIEKARREFQKQVGDFHAQATKSLSKLITDIGQMLNKQLKGFKLPANPKLEYNGPLIPVQRTLLPKPTPILTEKLTKTLIDSRGNESGELSGPEQRILNAIAWMESIEIAEPEQPAIAFLAGYRYGGGAFNNPKGSLRSKGLIEYVAGEKIKLTESGRSLAQFPERSLTTEELHKCVMDRLPGPARKILQPLLDAYPEMILNEELAEKAGYKLGGAFHNPKGRLRSLGLIEYVSGGVKAKSLLFLE